MQWNAILRKMVENKECRVNFAMAEALAFGTLALHRGEESSGGEGDQVSAAEGLNRGAYAVSHISPPLPPNHSPPPPAPPFFS